jgi:hypothetical protein
MNRERIQIPPEDGGRIGDAEGQVRKHNCEMGSLPNVPSSASRSPASTGPCDSRVATIAARQRQPIHEGRQIIVGRAYRLLIYRDSSLLIALPRVSERR